MRFVLAVLSIFCLFSCTQEEINHNGYDVVKAERLSNEAIIKTAKQIENKTGLYFCGEGGGIIDGIRMLYLAFDCYKEISIEEARALLITGVEEFLAVVNADERIYPYLKDGYPFKPKNVKINIFLRNPDGSNPGPSKMWVAVAYEGYLAYRIHDSEDVYKSITVLQESYEEALQKLKEASELRAKPKTSL